MKKLYFICFCLFFFGGLVFAKEWNIKEANKIEISNEKKQNSFIDNSNKKTLKQGIQQFFQPQKKTESAANVDVCFWWKEIFIRDNLAKKTKESSDKIFWLIDLALKIGYDTDSLEVFAEKLESVWSQIKNDCLLPDLNKHRQQIKNITNSLKKEIIYLRAYIVDLRNQ